MATIVFVHGIDNQRETADSIEAAWTPALAGGVRLAGRGDIADRLWPPRSRPDGIVCRAAYYGGLFRSPDQQGARDDLRDLTPEQTALADALSREWLERVVERAPAGSPDAYQAGVALDIIRDPERVQAQGLENLQRQALKTLARVSWIAKPGMAFAERFIVTALTQVTRYMTDEMIREQARKALLDFVDADTRVVIGHSLGSVVAYECAHLLTHPLPLLLTIGSPLGVRTIVTERLSPAPSFPPMVTVWLNVANREDIVAAEPDLSPLFGRDVPSPSRFASAQIDEACEDPHSAKIYLGRNAVGRAVIEALK